MTTLLLSAGSAAADDIRDIRGPIALAAPAHWGLWVALGIAALALVWGLGRLLRRRRARPLSPYERARAQLTAAASDAEGQRPDVFAERVSSAVREYVEARFQLPATHRTSEEFLSDLLERDDIAVLSSQRPVLASFLHTCDFAKFAGRSLHGEVMRSLRAAALQFIDAAEAARSGDAP